MKVTWEKLANVSVRRAEIAEAKLAEERANYDGAMHEVGELVRVLGEVVYLGRSPATVEEWLRLNWPNEVAALVAKLPEVG